MTRRIVRIGALVFSFLPVVVACSSGEIVAETSTTTTSLAPPAADEVSPTSVPEPGLGFGDFEGDIEEPDFGVSTDLAQARTANDGRLPAQEALDLFAAVFGDVPGADGSRFVPRPGDGSLAIRAVFRVWDDLDADQRRAIEATLASPGPQAIGSATGLGVAFRPNASRIAQPMSDIVAEGARAQAALEAALGRSLGLVVTIEAVPADTVTVAGRTVAGWAAATRGGVEAPAGRADGCLIRVSTEVTYATLVHEYFHCFQYDAVPDATTVYETQDWIMEGAAEWATTRIAGVQPGYTEDFAEEWALNTESIFGLDYAGIGFFWTIEDMGVNPFDVALGMLGHEGEEAVAATGLEPDAVAPRIPSEKAAAHRTTPSFSVSDVWQLDAPDAPILGSRTLGTVSHSRPIDRTDTVPGWAPMHPGQVRIDGEGIVHVSIMADAGFVEFEGQENEEFAGSFDERFCLREGGCVCGVDDEVDSGLPDASENLFVTGIQRDDGEISYLIELQDPRGFPDGVWKGMFTITSVRFGVDGNRVVGDTRTAPFSVTAEGGALTGDYVVIQDQRLNMGDGGYADGVGTLQGVFGGCSYLPTMTAMVLDFHGVADLGDGLGPRPFAFSQPTCPPEGMYLECLPRTASLRPWTFETISEDGGFVSGSIDTSANIAFMKASGLSWVDDVTMTFEATRTG